MVTGLLKFHEPDIIGLQEALANQLGDLKLELPEFEFAGFGRDDGKAAGEYSPIAFRRTRFIQEGTGVFWLSETPDRPSRGYDAAFPRIATFVHIVDRVSGRRILALNTHWDHLGATARRHSAAIIKDFVLRERRKCEFVVLLGDLNATNAEESYRDLTAAEAPYFTDAREVSITPPFGPTGTYNAFDIRRHEELAIDHIFLSGRANVLRYGVITQHAEGKLPSDHYPVLADFELEEC